ncbi:GNAT family protein [Rugamonas sp.]|uniref:GNAT family N-acetyltransferase n=1 Tax=Rugamonas sp. TaxID=1926287 RepID=UPI0025FA0065|nr:GNAT family protein [Rugamonas sp.]
MLKGSLCSVRHVLTADLSAFIALVNDLPSRGAYFSTQFKSPETMRKEFMLNGFVTEDSELFVIEDSRHHVIGVISHFKSRTPVSREIGYRLFDPSLAGRGYTTEATRLLVDYLFQTQQYHRLELLTAPDNAASVRIAQKCGFSAEGVLRQAFFLHGRYCDVALYSLLRPEWERRRA